MMKHPEILEEIKEIEKTISTLTAHVAPKKITLQRTIVKYSLLITLTNLKRLE